jgi:hypothetical protein
VSLVPFFLVLFLLVCFFYNCFYQKAPIHNNNQWRLQVTAFDGWRLTVVGWLWRYQQAE